LKQAVPDKRANLCRCLIKQWPGAIVARGRAGRTEPFKPQCAAVGKFRSHGINNFDRTPLTAGYKIAGVRIN